LDKSKCTGGLCEETSQGMDVQLTTNKLFKTMKDLGGDFAAFNIQRGRNHGLPPYNDCYICQGFPPPIILEIGYN
jgi:hypothetical protein